MKMVKFFLMVTIALFMVLSVNAEKKSEKTVIYHATLHCSSCKSKVEKNIAYEKGVKNLKVDMEAQTITVTFREDKNSTEGIKKAIEKLDIPVKGMANDAKAGKAKEAKAKDCCAGDKKDCEKK